MWFMLWTSIFRSSDHEITLWTDKSSKELTFEHYYACNIYCVGDVNNVRALICIILNWQLFTKLVTTYNLIRNIYDSISNCSIHTLYSHLAHLYTEPPFLTCHWRWSQNWTGTILHFLLYTWRNQWYVHIYSSNL